MAQTDFRSCSEATRGVDFSVRLDGFAEWGAADEVRCGTHPPTDKVGWTLVVYDDGHWVTGPEGILGPQVWKSGVKRRIWFRTGGRILGPNVPGFAVISRQSF